MRYDITARGRLNVTDDVAAKLGENFQALLGENFHIDITRLVPPTFTAKQHKVKCGACGCKEFKYDESSSCGRSLASNRDGALIFNSYSEEHDAGGDDDPGVVCANCDTIMDTTDVGIDFS